MKNFELVKNALRKSGYQFKNANWKLLKRIPGNGKIFDIVTDSGLRFFAVIWAGNPGIYYFYSLNVKINKHYVDELITTLPVKKKK